MRRKKIGNEPETEFITGKKRGLKYIKSDKCVNPNFHSERLMGLLILPDLHCPFSIHNIR